MGIPSCTDDHIYIVVLPTGIIKTCRGDLFDIFSKDCGVGLNQSLKKSISRLNVVSKHEQNCLDSISEQATYSRSPTADAERLWNYLIHEKLVVAEFLCHLSARKLDSDQSVHAMTI